MKGATKYFSQAFPKYDEMNAAVQENAYRFVRENYDYEEKAKEYMNVIRDVAHKE